MNGDRPEHDRFDDDLRSVLREETPTDAPLGLRQRVAAIPTAMPVPTKPRRTWSLALPLLATAAGAFVLVVAIATLRAGQTPPSGAGGQPSPSLAVVASEQAASAVPSAVPSVVPARTAEPSPSSLPKEPTIATCPATGLTGRILDWQGAAGSRIADVTMTNTSGHACLIIIELSKLQPISIPGLALVDSSGTVLIGPGSRPSPSPVTSTDSIRVEPGASLRTQVRVANYCGPDPKPPIDIRLTLPGAGGDVMAKPAPGVSSANAIPPCNGPNGPEIDMNGWQR